jgi:dipeptidyl aminopeptidase/acylaminoacyl peptidase
VLFDSQKRVVRWASDRQHGPVFGLAFSPDGQRLAAASFDKSIWVLDVATGRALAPVLHTEMEPFSLEYSPAGDRLAAGADRQAMVWDALTGTELNRFGDLPSRVDSVALSKGEPLLAAADFSGHIYVWNLGLRFRIGHWEMVLPDGTLSHRGRLAWLEGNRLLLAWDQAGLHDSSKCLRLPPLSTCSAWPNGSMGPPATLKGRCTFWMSPLWPNASPNSEPPRKRERYLLHWFAFYRRLEWGRPIRTPPGATKQTILCEQFSSWGLVVG